MIGGLVKRLEFVFNVFQAETLFVLCIVCDLELDQQFNFSCNMGSSIFNALYIDISVYFMKFKAYPYYCQFLKLEMTSYMSQAGEK